MLCGHRSSLCGGGRKFHNKLPDRRAILGDREYAQIDLHNSRDRHPHYSQIALEPATDSEGGRGKERGGDPRAEDPTQPLLRPTRMMAHRAPEDGLAALFTQHCLRRERGARPAYRREFSIASRRCSTTSTRRRSACGTTATAGGSPSRSTATISWRGAHSARCPAPQSARPGTTSATRPSSSSPRCPTRATMASTWAR